MKELKTANDLLEQIQKELIKAIRHSDEEKIAICQKKLVEVEMRLREISL